nr:MAG TPA: hypothetical protein [Caudoviricetes sp.]
MIGNTSPQYTKARRRVFFLSPGRIFRYIAWGRIWQME